MICTPNNGGCWFCHKRDKRLMCFCDEFDTFLHKECLLEAWSKYKRESFGIDRELEIIAKEFGLPGI